MFHKRSRKMTRQSLKGQMMSKDWMERFLEQELLNLNPSFIKTCNRFDPKNELCRCCRFYSIRTQRLKFNRNCNYWYASFGRALRETLEKLTVAGVTINMKFLNLWRSRHVIVPPPPETLELSVSDTDKIKLNVVRMSGRGK